MSRGPATGRPATNRYVRHLRGATRLAMMLRHYFKRKVAVTRPRQVAGFKSKSAVHS